MNASERANNLEVATKIAAVVNLFKNHFPDARADLKPWANDQDTRDLVDPDSLDLGFHFPGRSRLLASRSLLVQIRFHTDPLIQSHRAIGLEIAGFDHKGKQWQISTIDNWTFEGDQVPTTDSGSKLKQFCQQVFELFNHSGFNSAET